MIEGSRTLSAIVDDDPQSKICRAQWAASNDRYIRVVDRSALALQSTSRVSSVTHHRVDIVALRGRENGVKRIPMSL